MNDAGRFPPIGLFPPRPAQAQAEWSDAIVAASRRPALRNGLVLAEPQRDFVGRLAAELGAGADVVVQKSAAGDGSVTMTVALLEASGASVQHAPLGFASTIGVHNDPTSMPAKRVDVLVIDEAGRDDLALIDAVRNYRGKGYVFDAAGAAPVLLHADLRVVVVTQGNATDRAALSTLQGFTQVRVADAGT